RAKRLDKIDRLSRDPKDGASLGFAFKPPERSGRVVFELDNGRITIGDRVLLEDGELWLERGEHVSLVGPNGSGKTTLIETLAGVREFADAGEGRRDAKGRAIKDGAGSNGAGFNGAGAAAGRSSAGPLVTGKLRTGHNVKIGFLSQHAEELHAGNARTVVEACTYLTKLTPGSARALLGRFLFSGEDADKPLEGLSGGERRRLSLAVLVQSGANVLILDEPTNHLDLESREALEEALGAFEGSILLISHDRALLDAVGSRTVAFEERSLRSYTGGWPEYLRVREESAAAKAAVKAQPAAKKLAQAAKPVSNKAPKLAKSSGPERKLEQRIEAAEAALSAIEDELAGPEAWSTPQRSADSTARHERAKREIEALYDELERIAT
ncbi:MAG: ATP-binding cassette domain-containing protein, partial [Solirubrobacteraceae bacterium]